MFRKSMIVATAFGSFLATDALAIDLPPEVYMQQETGTMSIGQGWYIRGDFGYNNSIMKSGQPTTRNYNSVADTYASTSFDQSRMSGDYSIAAGLGYQFNDFLRTDLTVDYFKGTLNGKTTFGKPCMEGLFPAGTGCSFDDSRFSALGVLANGYVDLGTYWGITPYVGAGAGMTNLSFNNVTQKVTCRTAIKNSDCGETYTSSGADSWRMTYALMAGASYDLTTHTKIDLGYRYSHVSGGDMFGFSPAEALTGAYGTKGKDKGFGRHEFRAGLRLTTW